MDAYKDTAHTVPVKIKKWCFIVVAEGVAAGRMGSLRFS
jgi:hypothetical protein